LKSFNYQHEFWTRRPSNSSRPEVFESHTDKASNKPMLGRPLTPTSPIRALLRILKYLKIDQRGPPKVGTTIGGGWGQGRVGAVDVRVVVGRDSYSFNFVPANRLRGRVRGRLLFSGGVVRHQARSGRSVVGRGLARRYSATRPNFCSHAAAGGSPRAPARAGGAPGGDVGRQ